MRCQLIAAATLLLLLGGPVVIAQTGAQTETPGNATLTAVPGIRVGHYTYTERPTGCTAVLVDGDAVGGVSQRGGAPATRETDLLNPLNMVDKVNAISLSGGSAFGLDAATGISRWLEEHGVVQLGLIAQGLLFSILSAIKPNFNGNHSAPGSTVRQRRALFEQVVAIALEYLSRILQVPPKP